MSKENHSRVPEGLYVTKGICTDANCPNQTSTNSESNSWRTPSKLKQEVQTIIDIMGPPIKPYSTFNTSSEADNEESIFTNSKVSTGPKAKSCECDMEFSDKTDELTISKDEADMSVLSAAADNNTSRISDLEPLPCDQRCQFPMMFDPTFQPQYICPPPLLPANICINSECLCPQMATMLHTGGMPTAPIMSHQGILPAATPQHDAVGEPKDGRSESRRAVDANTDDKYVMFNYTDSTQPRKPQNCQRASILNWLRAKLEKLHLNHIKYSQYPENDKEYYKMNIKRNRRNDNSPPRRVVFELVPSGILKGPPCDSCALIKESKCSQKFYYKARGSKSEPAYQNMTNNQHEGLQKTPGRENDFQGLEQINTCQTNNCCASININNVRKSVGKTTYVDAIANTRVDVYYFDHGNSTHFKTTDSPPIVTTEELSEKIERKATRYWAEMFGSGHLLISFITSFILQLFRYDYLIVNNQENNCFKFMLYSILRPLTIGILQLASDYLFKPLLATLFNGVLQPILIFLYNIATSVRDLLEPLAEGIGYFFRELAVLVGSFRLYQKIEGCGGESVECKDTRKRSSKKCSKSPAC